MLEIITPLLDKSNPHLREIALCALANSPTQTDHDYLVRLVNSQDSVSEDLLNCFYNSKNIENLKYWLKLLYTKLIPKEYVIIETAQPLIRSDAILPELQTALLQIKDPEILGDLVCALKDRTDDKSVDIMIGFLKHENSTVWYWAAKTLKNNHSPKIETREIKKLIHKNLEDSKDESE